MTSPLEIRILLHHYYSPAQWRGEENPDMVAEIQERFTRLGLLEAYLEDGILHHRIASRGTAYALALCRLPFPEPRTIWHIPTFEMEIHV